jgi:hypothetical protein
MWTITRPVGEVKPLQREPHHRMVGRAFCFRPVGPDCGTRDENRGSEASDLASTSIA